LLDPSGQIWRVLASEGGGDMVKMLPKEFISDDKIEPKLLLAKVKAALHSGVPCAGVF
jgi:hypothetical protein